MLVIKLRFVLRKSLSIIQLSKAMIRILLTRSIKTWCANKWTLSIWNGAIIFFISNSRVHVPIFIAQLVPQINAKLLDAHF